jgi:hypothetical protein
MRAHIGITGLLLFAALAARADTLTDWADTTTDIAIDGSNTIRTMALAQNAVYEAVNAITRRYPRDLVELGPSEGASLDMAIAAACRIVLLHESPELKASIEGAYAQTFALVSDDKARARGVSLGEKAAGDVLAKHTGDIGPIEPYRPFAVPGVYVPTTVPLGWAVAQHKPWIMKSADQFRPGPPPPLTSPEWARDYNETRTMGAVDSKLRTPEQTAIGRFWATFLPDVYVRVVRSVASAPGREITQNARLYAAVLTAISEAEIAVFEAKYHYLYWRPVTAIRNGDRDDNPATERDPNWGPLIATPVQPEYPCGHCILGATVATVIKIEAGSGPMPVLSTTSNTAPGVRRSWTRPEDLEKEVSNARIYDGVHFRSSANAGEHMGEQIAALVAAAYHLP